MILVATSEQKAKLHQKDPISFISEQNLKAALKAQRTHKEIFLSKSRHLSLSLVCKVSPLSRKISKMNFYFSILNWMN